MAFGSNGEKQETLPMFQGGERLYLGMDFGSRGARFAIIDKEGIINLKPEGKRVYPLIYERRKKLWIGKLLEDDPFLASRRHSHLCPHLRGSDLVHSFLFLLWTLLIWETKMCATSYRSKDEWEKEKSMNLRLREKTNVGFVELNKKVVLPNCNDSLCLKGSQGSHV